jgi:hypothetical protein
MGSPVIMVRPQISLNYAPAYVVGTAHPAGILEHNTQLAPSPDPPSVKFAPVVR